MRLISRLRVDQNRIGVMGQIRIGGYIEMAGNFIICSIVCLIGSLLLSYSFYSASISSIKNYGKYIKAVFDLYRFDLAGKMEIPMTAKHLIPDDDEVESWRKLRKYLLDYKK
jgi:hypothetical protein